MHQISAPYQLSADICEYIAIYQNWRFIGKYRVYYRYYCTLFILDVMCVLCVCTCVLKIQTWSIQTGTMSVKHKLN